MTTHVPWFRHGMRTLRRWLRVASQHDQREIRDAITRTERLGPYREPGLDAATCDGRCDAAMVALFFRQPEPGPAATVPACDDPACPSNYPKGRQR